MEQQYIRIVFRWFWLLILIPIIAGIAAYNFVTSQEPTYQAVSSIIIGPGISSPNPDFDELRTGALITQTYTELAQSTTFRQSVIDQLGLDMTVLELSDILEIRPIVDTQITKIVVNYSDPDIAIAMANQVADELASLSPSIEYNTFLLERINEQAIRVEQDIVNIQSRIEELKTQLENEDDVTQQAVIAQALTAEERGLEEANGTLANLYNTLQSAFPNQVEIADYATEAIENSQRLALTLMIAVAGGLVVSAMLLVLLIYLDTLQVHPETIRNYVDYPVWGIINLDSNNRTVAPSFLVLATQLIKQQEKNSVESLLITGIENSDHVAMLSSNLSKALSLMEKQVVLIDIDFSNNIIQQSFDKKDMKNLVDVIEPSDDKLDLEPLKDYPNLVVIPSGRSDANAIFQIVSRFSNMMPRFKDFANHIIVSAPSVKSFEQGTAMAGWTDGSIMVARQGRTKIADLKTAIEHLESVGGKVLGLVIVK